MLALLKDVPVINHPVFRIVLGAGLVVVGLTILNHSLILLTVGAFLLVMGLVRGISSLVGHTQKGQPQ
jgi:hypothetical protein